jgi:hypothetical protein
MSSGVASASDSASRTPPSAAAPREGLKKARDGDTDAPAAPLNDANSKRKNIRLSIL